jgi:hypothetical protein
MRMNFRAAAALISVAAGAGLAAAMALPGTAGAATIKPVPKAHAATRKPTLRFNGGGQNPLNATHTVTTQVQFDPDSGDSGNNWGLDSYTQVFTLHRVKEVATSDCGAGASRCYLYDYSISDKGVTQTIPGQDSPENPAFQSPVLTEDVVENVLFSGGTNDGQIYSSYKRAYVQYIPAWVNEDGVPASGNYSIDNWVNLFWDGAAFTQGNTLGNNAGWTYVAPKGADGQCTQYSGKWVDAQSNNWGLNDHGNILAPDAADCSSQAG